MWLGLQRDIRRSRFEDYSGASQASSVEATESEHYKAKLISEHESESGDMKKWFWGIQGENKGKDVCCEAPGFLPFIEPLTFNVERKSETDHRKEKVKVNLEEGESEGSESNNEGKESCRKTAARGTIGEGGLSFWICLLWTIRMIVCV